MGIHGEKKKTPLGKKARLVPSGFTGARVYE